MTQKRLALLAVSCAVAIASTVHVAGAAQSAPPASAERYPTRPIRFIVPFAPGGGNDRVARLIAGRLSEAWGEQVVVDNRPGGGGNIAAELVANASPDGYTIFLFNSANAIAPSLHKTLPWQPLRDFQPVILVATSPFALVVHPATPAKSVKELIALAKAKPGAYNYASGGTGSSTHLAGEHFKQLAGIDIVHVPYKGAAPAFVDLLAGRVTMYFSSIPPALPHIKAGRVRALGISSERRSPLMPDLPAISEAGVPGYTSGASYGIVTPARTPQSIVHTLNSEVMKILSDGNTRSILANEGADVAGGSPEDYARFMKDEIAMWARIVKAAHVQID